MSDYNPLFQVLDLNGYEYGIDSGPMGEEGWTKTISHADGLERLWITVSLENEMLYLYNEYNCGGELWSATFDIPNDLIFGGHPLLDFVNRIIASFGVFDVDETVPRHNIDIILTTPKETAHIIFTVPEEVTAHAIEKAFTQDIDANTLYDESADTLCRCVCRMNANWSYEYFKPAVKITIKSGS